MKKRRIDLGPEQTGSRETIGRTELTNLLAESLSTRADLLSEMMRHADALGDYDRAVQIRTTLVEQKGRVELLDDLATSRTGGGVAYLLLSRHANALKDLDRAVAIRSRLVEKEGRHELYERLAETLAILSKTQSAIGKSAKALDLQNKARDIRRKFATSGSCGPPRFPKLAISLGLSYLSYGAV